MSSHTLAEPSAAAEEAAPPRLFPRRHLGRWTAAVALGTLLAAAPLSANRVLKSVSWDYVRLFRLVPVLVRRPVLRPRAGAAR